MSVVEGIKFRSQNFGSHEGAFLPRGTQFSTLTSWQEIWWKQLLFGTWISLQGTHSFTYAWLEYGKAFITTMFLMKKWVASRVTKRFRSFPQSKQERGEILQIIRNHSTWHAIQSTHQTRPTDAKQSLLIPQWLSSCSRIPSTSVNARYPTPPRCIPILNRAQPPSIYLDYGIEMYRICSVSCRMRERWIELTIVCSSSPKTSQSSRSRHTAQLHQRWAAIETFVASCSWLVEHHIESKASSIRGP